MRHRLNITLPEQTIELLDRAAPRGQRSRLIDEAVRYFIQQRDNKLRKHLKRGARTRAARDLRVASEWFALPD